LKLLLDEMHSPVLAEALRAAGVDARTVVELGMAGSSDPEVFAAASADGHIKILSYRYAIGYEGRELVSCHWHEVLVTADS
jgi:uncharacterized protein DUF5615